MRRVFCDLLWLYWLVLFIRVLSSWFPRPTSGPLLTVWNGIYAVTDPVLRPLRGLIPPLRAGAMAMDFSPVLAFVILLVLIRAIC
jgi:YggT family protein